MKLCEQFISHCEEMGRAITKEILLQVRWTIFEHLKKTNSSGASFFVGESIMTFEYPVSMFGSFLFSSHNLVVLSQWIHQTPNYLGKRIMYRDIIFNVKLICLELDSRQSYSLITSMNPKIKTEFFEAISWWVQTFSGVCQQLSRRLIGP